jgi:hypothetical protein
MPRRRWAARPRRQVSATYHGSLTHLRVGARERYHKLSGDGLTRSSTVTKATDPATRRCPRRASGPRCPKRRATPGPPCAWARSPGTGRARRPPRPGRAAGRLPRAGSAGAAVAAASLEARSPEARSLEARLPGARSPEARAREARPAEPASGPGAWGRAWQESERGAGARRGQAAGSHCRPPGVPIRHRLQGGPIRCRPARAVASRSIARRLTRRRPWRGAARAATSAASAST